VINEGIKGWNVLYYLAAVKSDTLQCSSLEVAYQVSYSLIYVIDSLAHASKGPPSKS